MGLLTGKGIIVATTLRVSYEEGPMVVFWQQQLLLCLYTLYLAEVPSVRDKTTGNYSVQHSSYALGGCCSLVSVLWLIVTGPGQWWVILEPSQSPIRCVNYPCLILVLFHLQSYTDMNKYVNNNGDSIRKDVEGGWPKIISRLKIIKKTWAQPRFESDTV
jgi:hypothetical protein